MTVPGAGFTRAEAQRRVGRRVRARVALDGGIPKGAEGLTIRADLGVDGYDLAVEWLSPSRTRGLIDSFTRQEYDKFLIQLGGR